MWNQYSILWTVACLVMSTSAVHRLPKSLLPVQYVIQLIPTFTGNFTTCGEEWIHLLCTEETNKVIFNAKDINIEKITIHSQLGPTSFAVKDKKYNTANETYTLTLHKNLVAGQKYRMYMKFNYELNDKLQGFYKVSYDDSNFEKRWIAATQFSPIDARRAFPCWDEMNFKSKFTISLGRPECMKSLSNMPQLHSSVMTDRPGWIWDHYQTTLSVSSYLVAMMVFDFAESGKKPIRDNLYLNAWARPEVITQTAYASELVPKLLTELENYLGVQYPLPKLDIVAVPEFGFSGMENWGLITFRESSMLYDPNSTSVELKIHSSYVIAHEVTHLWFGDLVTPTWWNDLWLKEGLASFLGTVVLNKVQPELESFKSFVVDSIFNALHVDSIATSNSVSSEVQNVKEIREKFDSISYGKGAALINMIRNMIGEQKFKAGIRLYLNNFMYANADKNDFLSSFKNSSPNLSVKDVMKNWTEEPGYPVINLIRNYKNKSAFLYQERFFKNPISDKNKPGAWIIPVFYTTKSEYRPTENTLPKIWMSPGVGTTISDLPNEEWILVNQDCAGFYKVNYDNLNWYLLAKDIMILSELSRAQLLNNAFSLAASGYISYDIVLKLIQSCRYPLDYFSSAVINKHFLELHRMISGKDTIQSFKKLVFSIFPFDDNYSLMSHNLPSKIYDRLQLLMILHLFYTLEEPTLESEAKELAAKLISGQEIKIHPDLASEAYCSAIRTSNATLWNLIYGKYLRTNQANEKLVFLESLGCTKDPVLLERYLHFIIEPELGLRKQDAVIVFNAVAYNKLGTKIALNFLISNWDPILHEHGDAFSKIGNMVSSLSSLTDENDIKKVQKFYHEHKDKLQTAQKSLETTLEKLETQLYWIKHRLGNFQLILPPIDHND